MSSVNINSIAFRTRGTVLNEEFTWFILFESKMISILMGIESTDNFSTNNNNMLVIEFCYKLILMIQVILKFPAYFFHGLLVLALQRYYKFLKYNKKPRISPRGFDLMCS